MSGYSRKEVIGDCVLYLGDCLEIMPTLGKVDHVICDPPYENHVHESKDILAKQRVLPSGRKPFEACDFESIDDIREKFIYLCDKFCDGWLVSFCTIEGTAFWADKINKSTIKYKRPCVWVKPDSTPQFNGQCPAIGAECFITAWCGEGISKWNGGGKRGVYTYLTNQPDRTGLHPTEKPIPLMAEIVKDFTSAGQTVLDPFMGSGTTGVACVKLGRKFIGIELDEKYFDIACKRIEEAYKQPDLFIETPAKPVQEKIIFDEK